MTDWDTSTWICEYCMQPLRLFLDPRPGVPRPNFRCDCEGAIHGMRAFTDPGGVVWPESHQWLKEHGYPSPHFEIDQTIEED